MSILHTRSVKGQSPGRDEEKGQREIPLSSQVHFGPPCQGPDSIKCNIGILCLFCARSGGGDEGKGKGKERERERETNLGHNR